MVTIYMYQYFLYKTNRFFFWTIFFFFFLGLWLISLYTFLRPLRDEEKIVLPSHRLVPEYLSTEAGEEGKTKKKHKKDREKKEKKEKKGKVNQFIVWGLSQSNLIEYKTIWTLERNILFLNSLLNILFLVSLISLKIKNKKEKCKNLTIYPFFNRYQNLLVFLFSFQVNNCNMLL